MAWRLAKSLGKLRDQFDEMAPGRKTDSDGTIGNEAHQATTSDHNPNAQGVVCALDITHDPAHGVDTYKIADQILGTHDRRIKYVISNRRIGGGEDYARRNNKKPWKWYPYSGVNPHDHHFHTSVEKPDYDKVDPWQFKLSKPGGSAPPEVEVLHRGSKGERVEYLQGILHIPKDGIFGPGTEAAVRTFQTNHSLVVDGLVGPYTWKALLEGGPPPDPAKPGPTEDPKKPFVSGKGSWYSQYKGKYVWKDSKDKPNSNALGVPDRAQGISFLNSKTLGDWFEVRAPNGVVSIEQQTDIGPSKWTGKAIDISAAAAERFGYSPDDFPTGAVWSWRPVAAPTLVAGLSEKEAAVKFRDSR